MYRLLSPLSWTVMWWNEKKMIIIIIQVFYDLSYSKKYCIEQIAVKWRNKDAFNLFNSSYFLTVCLLPIRL